MAWRGVRVSQVIVIALMLTSGLLGAFLVTGGGGGMAASGSSASSRVTDQGRKVRDAKGEGYTR